MGVYIGIISRVYIVDELLSPQFVDNSVIASRWACYTTKESDSSMCA